ncbi:hypothetical protein WJX84_007392 [Apatococcus fuscideae]|uniref:Ubiquitin-like domain-containing protein n=1 Tax=Apatococcus fuscideae TaxID=2026836 RepID=A0AAW1SW01_9CHLO
MKIYIAHSGKTLDLNVQASSLVGAVQQLLASLTGISAKEQILMSEGVRLDASKPLAAYKLPLDQHNLTHDVFLYNKAHLRSSATMPPVESLPPAPLQDPVAVMEPGSHPLDASANPLVRTVPQFARQFQHDAQQGAAAWLAAQHWFEAGKVFNGEVEVQNSAMDAARGNIDQHYSYIKHAYEDFVAKYQRQRHGHAAILARFEADLQEISAMELHPAARTDVLKHMSDLVPVDKLRDWVEHCQKGHDTFVEKVSELEGIFNMLDADVNGLLMTGPPVALDELYHAEGQAQAALSDQASLLQVLEANASKADQRVLEATGQLGSDLGASNTGSMQPLDVITWMNAVAESHQGTVMPRMQACLTTAHDFATLSLQAKNGTTKEVVNQLRLISTQQSRIRALRDRMAGLKAVAARQTENFAELLLVKRIPAAYREALCEVMRRREAMGYFAASAQQLAEKMAQRREREVQARDRFLAHVERYLPRTVLSGLGLHIAPPHCQISVTAQAPLPEIKSEDIGRVPEDTLAANMAMTAPFQEQAESADAPHEAALAASEHPPADAANTDRAVSDFQAMEVDNARLRAQLAAYRVLEASRSDDPYAAAAGPAPSGAGSVAVPMMPAASPAAQRQGAMQASAMMASVGGEPGQEGSLVGQRQAALHLARDNLVSQLERELATSKSLNAGYEARIRHLEGMQRRSGGRGRSPSPASASARHSTHASDSLPHDLSGPAAPGGAQTSRRLSSRFTLPFPVVGLLKHPFKPFLQADIATLSSAKTRSYTDTPLLPAFRISRQHALSCRITCVRPAVTFRTSTFNELLSLTFSLASLLVHSPDADLHQPL